MARLITSGFELNSTAVGVEAGSASGTPTIQSTVVRSGQYALRIESLVSGTRQYLGQVLSTSDSNGPYFCRVYFNVATYPSATNRIVTLSGSGGFIAWMDISSTGAVNLSDEDGIIGTSSPLSLDTWYMLEVHLDRTSVAGAHVVRGRIDGVEFAGSNVRSLSTGVTQFRVGGNNNSEAQTQGLWYFDDLAVNDSSGLYQSSYPGPGKIVHLRPNAAGDANTFATQTGGTAGAANNYTRVNEVTPNDATSFNGASVLNQEDLFNVDDAGLSGTDTINVVAVGIRYRNNVADATAALQAQVEQSSGGTKSSSSAIIPNSTTWRTNSTITPGRYPLVTYQNPAGSAWTNTTVNSMQVGYKLTAANVNRVDVSATWALVEYAPPAEASGPSPGSSLLMTGIG